METARGEYMGMEWIDLDLPGVPDSNLVPATRGRTGPVRLITPKGKLPESWIRYMLEHPEKTPNYSHYLHQGNAIRPFDEAAVFPEARISYYIHAFDDFDLDTWARSIIDIPESVELRFTFERYKDRMAVEARTLRHGAATWVRKKIDGRTPFLDAFRPILGYFVRNCPRVPEGCEGQAMCGSHLNALLGNLTATGADMVRQWLRLPLEEHRDPNRASWAPDNPQRTLTVPPSMLPQGVTSITLKRVQKTAAILGEAQIRGGHKLVDDAQGTTVTLKATLPEAVLNSLKGRRLSDVIDAGWAKSMVVRTARVEEDKVVLRTYSQQEEVGLPTGNEDADEVERQLRILVESGENSMAHIDEDAMPVLMGLSPRDLLSTLTTLRVDRRVDLQSYGLPGWVLRSGPVGVEVERCPIGAMKDVVYGVLGKSTSD